MTSVAEGRQGQGALGASRSDLPLMARAGGLFVLANARYWTTVEPLVRAKLRYWQGRARAIPDPVVRAAALQKLRVERFNVEAAAMFATFAPQSDRGRAVEASVATEVIYNYLDALTEAPARDPLGRGHRLFAALSDVFVSAGELRGGYYDSWPERPDGGYLEDLVTDARAALSRMPSRDAVAAVARRTAERCGEAQVRMHSAPFIGDEQLERWATKQAQGTDLRWPEVLAGAAASGVTLHALIAAAADPAVTAEHATDIDAFYLRVSAVSMILDSVIDYERDIARTGQPGFIRYYDDRDLLARRAAYLSRTAARRATTMDYGARHMARLGGIVAYYTSDEGARDTSAQLVIGRVHRELRPLIWLTLPILRAWRGARGSRSPGAVRTPP
jgi:tetraprenyl-beta-curcumene synthase